MSTNPIYILAIISVTLSFILSIYFFITPNGKRASNYLLATLLLIFAFLTAHSFMVSTWAYMYFVEYVELIFFLYLFGFLLGPTAYLYIKSITETDFKLSSATFKHAIPFCIIIAFSILFFMIYEINPWGTIPVMFITAVLLLTHNLVYTVKIINTLKNNSYIVIKKSTKKTDIVKWSQILITFYIIMWFLSVNAFFIPQFIIKPKWCSYTMSIYLLFFFVFITVVMFKALLKPDFFIESKKNKKLGLNKIQEKEYFELVKSFISQKKIYRNPNIRLENIANSLGLPSRVISHVINEIQNQHFNDFINQFRIEESKTLITNTREKLTIQEIFYSVGFNSKSAFNNAFKRHTGTTPTEFRINRKDKGSES